MFNLAVRLLPYPYEKILHCCSFYYTVYHSINAVNTISSTTKKSCILKKNTKQIRHITAECSILDTKTLHPAEKKNCSHPIINCSFFFHKGTSSSSCRIERTHCPPQPSHFLVQTPRLVFFFVSTHRMAKIARAIGYVFLCILVSLVVGML